MSNPNAQQQYASATAFARSDFTEMRRLLDRDGFLALPGFLSQPEMAVLLSRLDNYLTNIVPGLPEEHVFYEDKSRPETLKQLQAMHTYDDYFASLFLEGKFRALASGLLDDEVVPKNMQYFNKPCLVGKPTPAHQDGYYFMLDPCEALTMWLALETVDEENGCVRYVRGSHRRGMRPHARTQTLGFSQGISDYPRDEDRTDEVAIPAQAGDLLVHHAMTIHRADGNRSANRSRRAMGLIYYGERAREDVARKQAYQQQLTREWKAAGQL